MTFEEDLKFHKLYPRNLDIEVIQQKINKPLDSYSLTFKKPAYAVLNEMIQTRVMEDSVSESPFKKHIVSKYVDVHKKGSLLASRNKLDSLRFNYQFGVKAIDENTDLKAFMTRNIEKRMFRRTPLHHELEALTYMVKTKQQENLLKYSMEDVQEEEAENPQ